MSSATITTTTFISVLHAEEEHNGRLAPLGRVSVSPMPIDPDKALPNFIDTLIPPLEGRVLKEMRLSCGGVPIEGQTLTQLRLEDTLAGAVIHRPIKVIKVYAVAGS